ncbi:hypothetical protein PMAYCL1PPCAC_14893, partial [Pristionchus mayeri]
FRIQSTSVINFCIITVYFAIVVLLIRLRDLNRHRVQAIKSIMIIAFFFLASQFLVFAMAYVSYFFPPSIATQLLAFHKKYSVVYALPAYSLTYYIHFAVSK